MVAVAPTRPGSQAGDENPEGLRLKLFADVASPSGYVRPLGRVVDWSADGEVAGAGDPEGGTRYRDPLGQFETTDVPVFETVSTEHGPVTPFVSTKGLLSVLVGSPMPPSSQVRNDGLSVTRGVLELRGALISRNTELSSASLIVQGRTSGYQAVVPAAISFDAEATLRGFGLRSYSFTAAHDFGPDLAAGLITDDVADMFVEFVPADGSEPYKRRVGRSRFLVRARDPRWARHARRRHPLDRAVLHVQGQEPVAAPGDLRRRRPRAPAPPAVDHAGRDGPAPCQAGLARRRAAVQGAGHRLTSSATCASTTPRSTPTTCIGGRLPGVPQRRALGHVLEHRSKEHVHAALLADRVARLPPPGLPLSRCARPTIRRAVRAGKVFLQHGVMGTKWMVPNYGKNIPGFETDLFVVSSEREKQYIVGDFGYDPDEVAVTGLSRFDTLLADDVPRQAPAADHADLARLAAGPRPYADSEYHDRWSQLLHDPRLRRLAQERTASRWCSACTRTCRRSPRCSPAHRHA